MHREDRPRDELAIKLAMAAELPETDLHAVVQAQRTDTMRALQDYTRLRRSAEAEADGLSWPIVLDSLIFATEAEVRWLDATEERLARASATTRTTKSPPTIDDPNKAADATAQDGETVR